MFCLRHQSFVKGNLKHRVKLQLYNQLSLNSNPSFATPQLGPLGSHQVSLNQGAFVHHVGTVTGGLPSRFAVVG